MASVCLAAMAQQPGKKQPSRLHIAGGTLYTSSGVPILLHGVDALISPGAKPDGNMDGKIVLIDRGVIGLTYDSLTKLLNQKLQGGKVQDLKVTSDKGQIKINGKVHKGIAIPFEVKGPVSVTRDGKLDLHASTEKAAKLPISGIADALGLNMQNLVGSKKGVESHGQDIVFDPDQLWGLPIHSHVSSARVEAKELVLVIGHAAARTKKQASVRARNANPGE
ncbi:MAG: hypothetical protein ACRD3E_20455 [Terriglobales bacterium]